eukprot:10071-Chlamydomonas_euryale.AAC.1
MTRTQLTAANPMASQSLSRHRTRSAWDMPSHLHTLTHTPSHTMGHAPRTCKPGCACMHANQAMLVQW